MSASSGRSRFGERRNVGKLVKRVSRKSPDSSLTVLIREQIAKKRLDSRGICRLACQRETTAESTTTSCEMQKRARKKQKRGKTRKRKRNGRNSEGRGRKRGAAKNREIVRKEHLAIHRVLDRALSARDL